MVTVINAVNGNDALVKVSKILLHDGHINSPRGQKTLEICDAFIVIDDVSKEQGIITVPERKLSMQYLNAEMKWYENGDLNVTDIEQEAKIWGQIKSKDGFVNSNYGFIVYKQIINGRSQFGWCVDKLKEDKDSRQCLINYNQVHHKYDGNKDFVCTISQQFVQRHQKLDSVVLMRSQDLIYGFCYDLPWFLSVQKKLAIEVGIDVGAYNHYAASLHVYEKHFAMLEAIAASNPE